MRTHRRRAGGPSITGVNGHERASTHQTETIDPFDRPSADTLCEVAQRLIADGATQEDVLRALLEQFGCRDELLGRASALAEERFLREGDWTWYETSRSFQQMLGPGAF